MKILNKLIQYLKHIPKNNYTCIGILLIILPFVSCGSVTGTSTSSNSDYETASESIETHNPTVEEIVVTTDPPDNILSEEPIILPESDSEEFSELQVHFINVGQGDSTLIICDSEAMLIDAGDDNQGTKVQNYLHKQGIETLKYVICTHPDSDHIGGMDVILYKFDCKTILMTEEEKDSNTYRDVIDTMESKNYKNTLPVVGDKYLLGDAEFTILAPSQLGSDSNDNSIAIILTHGDNQFLFTGDAEETEEQDIINCGISINADAYKVGHHGSSSSSSKEFLECISPTYAVISCGENNPYGHPHAETLNNLRKMGVKVFRTDEQGSIVATSDGKEISWNCAPSDTWKAGESRQNSKNINNSGPSTSTPDNITNTEVVEETPIDSIPTEIPNEITYICNTNTGKFHYPNCSSVNQMSEKNKLAVTITRDELISQGYVPCKRCNP